jgi:hypothetical protein
MHEINDSRRKKEISEDSRADLIDTRGWTYKRERKKERD